MSYEMDATTRMGVLEDAVELACRAPSLHNSQPWQWISRGEALHLYLEPTRMVHGDDHAREALISCGTVLDHLRVAMTAAGFTSAVERFPDAADPNHLAVLRFAAADDVTEEQQHRASAIRMRRTDRLPFLPPENWASVETRLRSSVEAYPVRFDVLADRDRPKLAEISQIADSLRQYDSQYHAEINWWTAPFEVNDGIPAGALVSAEESDRVDVNRAFPVTRNVERRTDIGDDHAKIVVLSTDGDGRTDALRCGEALSAVLLECTLAGLGTCPVTHVTELPECRQFFAELTGQRDLPQILIRVGTAPEQDEPPGGTPRRPIEDVLRVED